MHRLHGTPASSGVVIGPWAVVRPAVVPSAGRIEAGQVEAETLRAARARAAAGVALDGLAARVAADGHPDEAAIFSAQAAMARDPALAAMTEARIRDELVDAVGATLGAGGELAAQLRSLGDELLAARADDVLDVARRIARLVAGVPEPEGERLERPAIVVAHDLVPSAAATLPRDRLLGFALETGSPTAHAAILARAYGIPAVVGVSGLLEALDAAAADAGGRSGGDQAGPAREIAVDGDRGEVVVGVDEAGRGELEARVAATRAANARDLAEANTPARTRDGLELALLANIGAPDEAPRCVALGAQGVGLFRTEFLFLERSAPPTEEEQTQAYRSVVEAFRPHPVTIRLLDLGGDKPIPYLPIAEEANPFLGVRALRLATTNPGIFVTQLRAAYRAAVAGPVKVMAPMVADATDAETLLALAQEARDGLDRDGIEWRPVELGVMLEIPSAILVADSYFKRLAFGSLGTNDLLQYTVAVDRGNPALGRYQDSLHPALLRLVAEAVAAAVRSDIELSVCGEMGGDPVAALALVGLGVTKLSMAAGSLPRVRRAVIASDAEVLRKAAREALDLASAAEVRARFESLAVARSGRPSSG
jgi:phosphoenolpyruvate-protein phosphotransferase